MDIRRPHTYALCSMDDRQIMARLENPQTVRVLSPRTIFPESDFQIGGLKLGLIDLSLMCAEDGMCMISYR